MKKIVRVFILLLFVFVTACSSNAEESKNTVESDTTSKEEQKEHVEKNEDTSGNNKDSERNNTEKIEEVTFEPKYKVSDTWSIVPIDENANEKVALLTIDDAPDKYALQMAKTLKSLNANAIFFVNGHFIDTPEEKEILKQIHAMGFVIGNHTYSHPFLPDLSEEEQQEEIVRVNDMVEEIIGERPKFFRAPNGANTDFTKQFAKEEGMVLMNWSYGYDWNKEYMSKEAIADIMVNTNLLGNGANLLMHDREWTAAALGDIVAGLREKGYEIVDPRLIKTNE